MRNLIKHSLYKSNQILYWPNANEKSCYPVFERCFGEVAAPNQKIELSIKGIINST